MARSTRLVMVIKNVHTYMLYKVGNASFTAWQASD